MIQTETISKSAIYSQSEVCQLLNMTRPTLLKKRKDGLIECHFHKSNGRPFYYGSDLLKYINLKII